MATASGSSDDDVVANGDVEEIRALRTPNSAHTVNDFASPASAIAAATIGEATLVPPRWACPSSTAMTPVMASATAETSPYERIVHPASVCHFGFGTIALQPLPVAESDESPHEAGTS